MKYMNSIDFSKLPNKKHNGKSVVDLKLISNEKVKIKYNGAEGELVLKYSYSKGLNHYLECWYEDRYKTYNQETLKKCKINSLIQVDKNNFSKPTPKNWLYQRTDLHKFVDNPDDLKNYHIGSGDRKSVV